MLVCADGGPPVLDGNWWVNQNHSTKYGVVAGITDCCAFELSPPRLLRFRTVEVGIRLLDEFYAREDQRRRLLLDAIELVVEKEPIETPSGGEVYTDKHGYYDGLWWKGDHRLQAGFLTGYIACIPAGNRLYPRPVEYYVERITDWYRTGDEQEKIAIVLEKFKEQLP